MLTINDFSEDEVRALARVKSLAGTGFLKVVEHLIDDGKDALVNANDAVRIHRLQGRVEAYKSLLEIVDEAIVLDARSNRV